MARQNRVLASTGSQGHTCWPMTHRRGLLLALPSGPGSPVGPTLLQLVDVSLLQMAVDRGPTDANGLNMLQDRLELSERRACQIVGQHRSTQRHRSPRSGRRCPAQVAAQLQPGAQTLGLPASLGGSEGRGLEGQPQEGSASVAGGTAFRCRSESTSASAWAPPPAPPSCSAPPTPTTCGPSISIRPDRRRPRAQAAQHR